MIWRDIHLGKQFVKGVVFAAAFVLVGYLIPRLYLQYIDQTEYISYLHDTVFNKSTFKSCETQIAQNSLVILVSSQIEVQRRLYRIVNANKSEYAIIQETDTKSFYAKQSQPQLFDDERTLPCNLQNGTYLYRGILTYSVNGITKVADFHSVPFTIQN